MGVNPGDVIGVVNDFSPNPCEPGYAPGLPGDESPNGDAPAIGAIALPPTLPGEIPDPASDRFPIAAETPSVCFNLSMCAR